MKKARAMVLRPLIAAVVALVVAAAALAQSGAGPLDAQSDAGIYKGELIPAKVPIPINAMQSWILRLTNAQGDAIEGAIFAVDGGMPKHGHGLPTAPEVTEYLGDGRYRVEGLRFSMQGDWALSFRISAAAGEDRLIFRFRL